ncbi:MAG: hypothetical protein AB1659_13535, partial [Thermodesulfobacteriota bacterium]
KEGLISFCRGESPEPDIYQLGQQEDIRFWFSGHMENQKILISLTDVEVQKNQTESILFSGQDHYLRFRSRFLDWVEISGIPFDETERQNALWPEQLSMEGMDAMGQALLQFYLFSSYPSGSELDIHPFIKAAETAPFSYMVQNLMGWAHYRRAEYGLAEEAFSDAVKLNPSGVGATAGLMWCAIKLNQEEDALQWAIRKAELRGDAIEEATEKTRHLIRQNKNP